VRRERKKQKAAVLVTAVDELSKQLDDMASLRQTHSQLAARHRQLEGVAAQQQQELAATRATVAAQQQQLGEQAATIQRQAATIQQQEAEIGALRSAASSAAAPQVGQAAPAEPSAKEVSDQLAAALRAVLSGLPAKDSHEVQAALAQLPPGLLQRLHSCCREVSAHLHKDEVKEQPHAIQVTCC
jgi:hypothetical protein